MEQEVQQYLHYLHEVKKTAKNTELSYQRDLNKLIAYLQEQRIEKLEKVTTTCLNSYILFLEKTGMAAASISRSVAAIKSFFQYELEKGVLTISPATQLKPPKVVKKAPEVLSMDEVTMFLKQIGNDSPKEKRDKAMIELLYATGIRVSELVCLTKDSLNLKLSYIMVDQKRAVPFGQAAREALVDYLDNGRPFLIKEKETEMLFTNCSGDTISRQGFWKLIKYYGNKAGIQKDITPQTLRNSFAAHLMVAKLVDR